VDAVLGMQRVHEEECFLIVFFFITLNPEFNPEPKRKTKLDHGVQVTPHPYLDP
jgi:hypothetical protein